MNTEQPARPGMRYMLVSVLATAAAMAIAANTASFGGSWAQNTTTNPADFLTLELIQNGALLCGRMTATAEGTNRTSSSFLVGKINGNRADLELEGDWIAGGVHGVARITLSPGLIDWQVLGQTARTGDALDTSGLWTSARLRPQTWSRKAERSLTGWCSGHWHQIERDGQLRLGQP